MIKQEILTLQKERIYPSVTILMPTTRVAVDFNKEKILLKNLIKDVEEKLMKKVDKRTSEQLVERINESVQNIDFSRLEDGLGIFVNSSKSLILKFPFSVPSLTVIDDTFETKFLVKTYNRSMKYWLINLNEKATQLYEGFNSNLMEIKNDLFPFSLNDFLETEVEGTRFTFDSIQMEKLRQFVREANLRFRETNKEDLPIILSGVKKITSMYIQTNDVKSLIGTIEGSYTYADRHELGKKAFEIVQKYLAEKREEVYKDFIENIGYKKSAYGILDIWNLANEGRIDTLLVEENYHQGAKFIDNQPVLIDSTEDLYVIDDFVDEIIELVFQKKGKVYFYEDGKLKEFQRIGAILRY